MRGIFTKASSLGLSATINQKIKKEIDGILHWNPLTIAVLPDRPNIYLDVVHKPVYLISSDLKWITEGLKDQGNAFPKTIIFSQTKGSVNDIHAFLKRSLGVHAYHNQNKDQENRLVSKYHGSVSEDLQSWTLAQMVNPSSNLRVLVTTIAFGMGVGVSDVRTVIQWGGCKNMLAFWQQVGRAGRDGIQSQAIWYPKSTAGDDKELFDRIKSERDTCVRKVILSHFMLPGMDELCLDFLDDREACEGKCEDCQCAKCKCCSHCSAKCGCKA